MFDPRQKWNSYHPEQRRFVAIAAGLVIVVLILGFFVGKEMLSKPRQKIPVGTQTVEELATEAREKSQQEFEKATQAKKLTLSPNTYWLGKPAENQVVVQPKNALLKNSVIYAAKNEPEPLFNNQVTVSTQLNARPQIIKEVKRGMNTLPATKLKVPRLNTVGYLAGAQAVVIDGRNIITVTLGGQTKPGEEVKKLTALLVKLRKG